MTKTSVLMFHDIRDVDSTFFPKRYQKPYFLTPKRFLSALGKLRSRIISPEQGFRSEYDLDCLNLDSSNNLILTFDDGLLDHYTAAKALAADGISAVFFIPFGVIIERQFIQSHLIQFLIASCGHNALVHEIQAWLTANAVSDAEIHNLGLSNWGASNIWTPSEVFITRSLREALTIGKRDEFIRHLCKEYLRISLDDLHSQLYMTEKQIVEIRGMGHTIGSHGYFSYDLRFCDEQTVRSELSRSLEFLDRYPCLIKPIAYANGGYNKSVINHALRFGYTHGFGTQQAIGCPHLSMATPRIDPISAGF